MCIHGPRCEFRTVVNKENIVYYYVALKAVPLCSDLINFTAQKVSGKLLSIYEHNDTFLNFWAT